jgi:hypothetical protein
LLSASVRATASVPAANFGFSNAHRTVPEHRARRAEHLAEVLDRRGSDIERHRVGGNLVDQDDHGALALEARGDHDIGGQVDGDLLLHRTAQEVARVREPILLDLALAERLALRVEERVRHRAADDDRVDALEQRVEDLDLVRDLRAAEHGDVRPVDLAEQARQEVDLLGHHEAGALVGDELHHAGGRGVGAVRRAERVVDVDVAIRRERARDCSSLASSPGWNRRFSSIATDRRADR